MEDSDRSGPSAAAWTLKKAVTTLAIAPQTESLTRTGRMAYNLMIFKAQRMIPDEEGGYSAPLSEIIKGYGATTRDSGRVRGYIEQMCTTLVRWFPLSRTDEDTQVPLTGIEPAPIQANSDGRIFTLLSEARFSRRAGEQWVTWFFPPTIREMVIHPARWAQLDLQEMAKLSHYASVALYEICARYKDVPGGLTNRAEPGFWVVALRPDPDTKLREWRKFKNETLRPALAEICQKTCLDVELIEEKKGRAVVSVQFQVRKKEVSVSTGTVDWSLVERAAALNVRERDLDLLVEEYGEDKVKRVLEAMEGRVRAQPTAPINFPAAYLRRSLRNEPASPLFDSHHQVTLTPAEAGQSSEEDEWWSRRKLEINESMDELTQADLEKYAALAREALAASGLLTVAMQRRFDQKQFRSPMVWEYIRNAYAEQRYGSNWKARPSEFQQVGAEPQ